MVQLGPQHFGAGTEQENVVPLPRWLLILGKVPPRYQSHPPCLIRLRSTSVCFAFRWRLCSIYGDPEPRRPDGPGLLERRSPASRSTPRCDRLSQHPFLTVFNFTEHSARSPTSSCYRAGEPNRTNRPHSRTGWLDIGMPKGCCFLGGQVPS